MLTGPMTPEVMVWASISIALCTIILALYTLRVNRVPFITFQPIQTVTKDSPAQQLIIDELRAKSHRDTCAIRSLSNKLYLERNKCKDLTLKNTTLTEGLNLTNDQRVKNYSNGINPKDK